MKETVEEEIYKALCVGRLEKQQRDGLHPTLVHSSDPSAAEGCVSSSSEKQCPICARKFKSSSMNAEINAHIDACLAQQS
jgi:serine kinase of HPr protein (carbohydrate metabolism regulator)